VFRTVGEQCVWEAVDLAQPGSTQPIVTLPFPCAQNYIVSVSGQQALVTHREHVALVDIAAKTARPLPALGRDDLSVEIAEWDTTGKAVVWAGFQGEPTWVEEPLEGHYSLDGQVYPIKNDDEYSMPRLCVRLTESGGQLAVQDASIVFLHEGMSAPFCGNDDGKAIVKETGSGEGSDLLRSVSEADQAALAMVPTGEHFEGWVYIGEDHRVAMQAMWFEGQRLMTPIAVKQGDAWVGLEGFGHAGWALARRVDRFLVACDGTHAAVYDPEASKIVWSAASSCPVDWPL